MKTFHFGDLRRRLSHKPIILRKEKFNLAKCLCFIFGGEQLMNYSSKFKLKMCNN